MSMSTSNSNEDMKNAIKLLDSVYGPIDSPSFPLPMPSDEAGLCSDGIQRRYLWTDAFGVLCYTSLANRCCCSENYIGKGEEEEEEEASKKYHEAANKLIDVVHSCLGTPRSTTKKKEDDDMTKCKISPTGYVGLRIGKVHTRKITDYGMTYDGQYFHYIDKWLFALCRAGNPGHVEDGIRIAKSIFPYFFDPGPHGDGRYGGIRWKLSVDATPPKDLERVAHANDDTLNAFIVYTMLQQQQQKAAVADNTNNNENNENDDLNLTNEIQMLQNSLKGYTPRVTDDPLGWGLEAIFDQYVVGHPRSEQLRAFSQSALHSSHMSLPFRLYGAMIGARIQGEKVIKDPATVDRLIQMAVEYENRYIDNPGRIEEQHSSINRVMLAMCLLSGSGSPHNNGGALTFRKGEDPLIRL